VVEIAPAVIVPLEIDVVDKNGSVVGLAPKLLTSCPFIDEINAMAVDKLIVDTEPDVVIPVVFVVVAFTVAADAVPVTVREFTPAAPDTVKDPALAALVTVKEFTPAAPDTVRAPITAEVAAKVPVTVLLRVNREPPEIDPLITAVAPLTAPVAFRVFKPIFPENDPLVPEIAPNEVKEPTWALFVTRIALPNTPLFA
jgi:hypothetical protein